MSKDNITGQKIVKIRHMTPEEAEFEGWEDDRSRTTVLVLANGTVLYPSRDEEGNGAGELFGKGPQGTGIMVTAGE